MQVDPNSVDERVAAIHCLGYLIRFVPKLMIPYLEPVLAQLDKIAFWYHPNVRIQILASYMQVILGLASIEIGDTETYEYKVGEAQNLGIYCDQFLQTYYFPHVKKIFEEEEDETNLEKMLQTMV